MRIQSDRPRRPSRDACSGAALDAPPIPTDATDSNPTAVRPDDVAERSAE
jgi:hypothetical protein